MGVSRCFWDEELQISSQLLQPPTSHLKVPQVTFHLLDVSSPALQLILLEKFPSGLGFSTEECEELVSLDLLHCKPPSVYLLLSSGVPITPARSFHLAPKDLCFHTHLSDPIVTVD